MFQWMILLSRATRQTIFELAPCSGQRKIFKMQKDWCESVLAVVLSDEGAKDEVGILVFVLGTSFHSGGQHPGGKLRLDFLNYSPN